MDTTYPLEAEQYRTTIKEFLTEQLPAGWKGMGALSAVDAREFAHQWRRTLHEHGLLAASWPKQYGGAGLSEMEQVVLAEEFYRAGVPLATENDTFGIQMVGNTILQWGSEEQKSHFLPRILSGDDRWCQGYSEPNAGSDLANVGTTAMSGSSTDRKFGRLLVTWRTGYLFLPAPNPTWRSTRAFRFYSCRCSNLALKFDRSK
jgi:alkylation response protein AidB-like acyl-CoA dehydrogenase